MTSQRVTVTAIALGAAAALACGGTAGQSSAGASQLDSGNGPAATATDTPPASGTTGFGTFRAYLTDAPNPEVNEIWVRVLSVTAHVAGTGWVPLTMIHSPYDVDLLKLHGAVSDLGFLTIPPGTVTQIR